MAEGSQQLLVCTAKIRAKHCNVGAGGGGGGGREQKEVAGEHCCDRAAIKWNPDSLFLISLSDSCRSFPFPFPFPFSHSAFAFLALTLAFFAAFFAFFSTFLSLFTDPRPRPCRLFVTCRGSLSPCSFLPIPPPFHPAATSNLKPLLSFAILLELVCAANVGCLDDVTMWRRNSSCSGPASDSAIVRMLLANGARTQCPRDD